MTAILLSSILLGFLAIGSATRAQSADVAHLEEMQKRIVVALIAGQREEYAAMLAPEWRVTHVDGRVLTKAEILEQMFEKGASPLAELYVEDVEVRLFGDAAVVIGRTRARSREGAQVVLRFSDFAVKRNGRWVIVGSHATAIEPPR